MIHALRVNSRMHPRMVGKESYVFFVAEIRRAPTAALTRYARTHTHRHTCQHISRGKTRHALRTYSEVRTTEIEHAHVPVVVVDEDDAAIEEEDVCHGKFVRSKSVSRSS